MHVDSEDSIIVPSHPTRRLRPVGMALLGLTGESTEGTDRDGIGRGLNGPIRLESNKVRLWNGLH